MAINPDFNAQEYNRDGNYLNTYLSYRRRPARPFRIGQAGDFSRRDGGDRGAEYAFEL